MKFSYQLEDILNLIGEASVEGRSEATLCGIATLQQARKGDISFLGNRKYRGEVSHCHATLILLPYEYDGSPKEDQLFLRVPKPSLALAQICAEIERKTWPAPPPGIHPSAVIDRDAVVADSASIGPFCHVASGARIGEGTVLTAHVHIGSGAMVGERCRILPQVFVGDYCELGNEVLLSAGVVIGSDGFGYEFVDGKHRKIPQIGVVRLGDCVEIGANTTVDRARFSETFIGEGTKIDNLVQIGHNVRIGKHCLIVAQVGISGSTELEDFVVVGGQTGIAGHLKIGARSQIGGQSGVSKSVPAESIIQGAPACDIHLFRKICALQRKLPDTLQRVQELEKHLETNPQQHSNL